MRNDEPQELLAGVAAVTGTSGRVGNAVARALADFRAVNVDATEALLDDAGAAGVRRIVYISSTSVYGDALVPADRAVWVDESLTPRPRDIYDETKLAAEQLVESSAIRSMTLRIARCFPEPPPVLATHRLHDSTAAADAFGYDPAEGVLRLLREPGNGLHQGLGHAGEHPPR